MGKAFYCNRCLECFNPEWIGEGEEFVSMEDIRIQTRTDFLHHTSGERYPGETNFCPACSRLFRIFMEHKEDLVEQSFLTALQEDYDALLKERAGKDEKTVALIDGDYDGDVKPWEKLWREHGDTTKRIFSNIVSRAVRDSETAERKSESREESLH